MTAGSGDGRHAGGGKDTLWRGGLCVSSLRGIHNGSALFLHVSCPPRSFSKLGWGGTEGCRRDCFPGSQDTFMCPAGLLTFQLFLEFFLDETPQGVHRGGLPLQGREGGITYLPDGSGNQEGHRQQVAHCPGPIHHTLNRLPLPWSRRQHPPTGLGDRSPPLLPSPRPSRFLAVAASCRSHFPSADQRGLALRLSLPKPHPPPGPLMDSLLHGIIFDFPDQPLGHPSSTGLVFLAPFTLALPKCLTLLVPESQTLVSLCAVSGLTG